MTKKKYFPNNWRAIKDAPDDVFSSPNGPLTFDSFMEWRVHGYELPSSVACIIRVQDPTTKKVKEHVYSKPRSAIKFINRLMDEDKEFVICDEAEVRLMLPEND